MPTERALHLICNVRLSGIPLYLAAGPSLELSTSNTDTAAWLHSRLVPPDDIESERLKLHMTSSRQLDVGILLKVEGLGSSDEVTGLLLYAEVQNQKDSSPVQLLELPKTPAGSSAHPFFLLKVYALPLCSEIIKKPHTFTGEEVPDLSRPLSSSNKRKSLTDLFEDAALQRRKFNGRGGERVLKALSTHSEAGGQQGSGPLLIAEEVMENANHVRKSLSRASSVTAGSNSAEASLASQGANAHGKRSSLRHMENASSLHQPSAAGNGRIDYAEQNRVALAKVVMAGMRLYGLQQRKKRANQPQHTSDMKQHFLTADSDNFDDGADEYKLIYHQTFKAAIFSFRYQISSHLLGQETMRDVVDRLLDIFCSNHMITEDRNGFPEAPGVLVHARTDAFDLPSSSAPSGSACRTWSTPATERPR